MNLQNFVPHLQKLQFRQCEWLQNLHFLIGTQVIQKQVQNWEDRMQIIEKSSSYNSQVREREWKVSSGDLQKVLLKSSAKNWSVHTVWKLLQAGKESPKQLEQFLEITQDQKQFIFSPVRVKDFHKTQGIEQSTQQWGKISSSSNSILSHLIKQKASFYWIKMFLSNLTASQN